MVDRCADGLGVGRVAGRAIIEWCGNGLLNVHHVTVAQLVELAGGDAGLDEGCDVIEHLGGQAACDAHFLDVGGGFDYGGHVDFVVHAQVGADLSSMWFHDYNYRLSG